MPLLAPDYRDSTEALVHKDLRLAFDGNRYCVPSRYVGHKLTVKADSSSVTIYYQTREIVRYARCWERGQTFGAERFQKELYAQMAAAQRSAAQQRLVLLFAPTRRCGAWSLACLHRASTMRSAGRWRKDLDRLAGADPEPDAAWAALLVSGLKQSGAPASAITAAEDKLSHDYPASSEAFEIADERWGKQVKEPEDQKYLNAWTAYAAPYRKQRDCTRQRVHFPGCPHTRR